MAIGWFNGHMGGIVRYIICRHVFLLIGLLSLGLFFVVPGSTERARSRLPAHSPATPARSLSRNPTYRELGKWHRNPPNASVAPNADAYSGEVAGAVAPEKWAAVS